MLAICSRARTLDPRRASILESWRASTLDPRICSRAILHDPSWCRRGWDGNLETDVQENLIHLFSRSELDKQGWSSQGDWPFGVGEAIWALVALRQWVYTNKDSN